MIKRKKIWASCGVFVGISALESTCLIWGSTYLSDTIGLSADMACYGQPYIHTPNIDRMAQEPTS